MTAQIAVGATRKLGADAGLPAGAVARDQRAPRARDAADPARQRLGLRPEAGIVMHRDAREEGVQRLALLGAERLEEVVVELLRDRA